MFHPLRYLHAYNIPTHDSVFFPHQGLRSSPALLLFKSAASATCTVGKTPSHSHIAPSDPKTVSADIYMLCNHSSGSPWPRLIFGCFLVKWGHMGTQAAWELSRCSKEGNDENLSLKASEDLWLSSHTLPHEGITYTLLFPWIYIFKYSIASLLFPPG